MTAAQTVEVAKKGRGGKRPGAGRKPTTGTAKVSPPPAPASPTMPTGGLVAGIEYGDARAAHEYWKAQLAEQTFHKNAGDLLDRAEVEQGNATLFAKIAQTIRGWPDNVERTAGLSPAQAEELEKMVDGLCLSIQGWVRRFGEATE